MMASSRTKKATRNILINFANQFITLLLSFLSRTVFIHTLGVEFLGINGLFSDVLGMLSMVDLGFNTAMVYSFYEPIAEGDQRKIAALITFYRRIYNWIATGVATVGLCLMPFIPYIVNTEKKIPLLQVYYLFALAGVVISYLFVYKTSIITADQKNYLVTRITIVISIFRTLFQILLLLIFKNFIVYLMVGLIFNLVNNVLASHKAVAMYPYINNKEKLDKYEINEIFSNLKSVFIYKISSTILTATDNIIISILVGTVAVGYYSNYLMISNKLVQMIALVFSSLTAGIGNVIVTENAKKRYEIFYVEQTISFIICGIVTPCFFSLVNDLLVVWLGKDFSMGYEMAFAVTLNVYLSCVLQPLWSYREATGLYRKTKWVMATAAICNLILSIFMGKIMGVVGIILASSISRVVTYVWFEPRLLFREYFEKSCFQYFKDVVYNLCIIIILSVIFMIISQKIVVTGWTSLLGKGILYVIISLTVMTIVYNKTEGFMWFLERVKRMF